jgi:hypothetical protein
MLRTVEDQVRKTYFSLRLSAAVIAFTFPVLLWLGGLHAGFTLRDSMSAYCHATPTSLKASDTACTPADPSQVPVYPEAGIMRNWFVGLLFAIGAILHANKGHTEKENWALSLAGIFAALIAVFPMPWACKSGCSLSAHGFCAISFFLSIAFVSPVCSRDTVQLLKPEKQTFYCNLYWLWGGLMVVAPATAYCFNKLRVSHRLRDLLGGVLRHLRLRPLLGDEDLRDQRNSERAGSQAGHFRPAETNDRVSGA